MSAKAVAEFREAAFAGEVVGLYALGMPAWQALLVALATATIAALL